MKKLFATIIGLAVGASLVHAQGWLALNDQGAGVTTNTGTLGNTTVYDASAGFNSLYGGKIWSGNLDAGSFYFTLLYIPNSALPTAGDTASPAGPDWVQLALDNGGTPGAALSLTNYPGSTAGGIDGYAGVSQQAIGIGGQAYNGGTSYYTMLVGWSANLGTSFSTVLNDYSTGTWTGASLSSPGFFGFEQGGDVAPNSASPGTGVGALGFGNNTLVLYSVPVPEPTTLALAGLGGLSMLFLRRRKV